MRPILPLLVLTLSLVPVAAQGPRFADVTSAAGLVMQHRDPGNLMGAGIAALDYDQDGWTDLFITAGLEPSRLWRNRGDGTFEDVTLAAGLMRMPVGFDHAMCTTVGDVDGDGWPDLFVGWNGENRLWRNQRDGTFVDATPITLLGSAFTAAAAFGDMDGDGDVDLYVGDYILVLNFPNHTPDPNHLYLNDGSGNFTEVTAFEGVAGAGCTLAVDWTDYDDDGDLDLIVANDFGSFVQPNRIYRNDGAGQGALGGRFTEVSGPLGMDLAIYCMGITFGDIDRDGDLDSYFSNLGRNVLLRNDGAAGFTDVTDATGTANTFDLTAAPGLFATSWSVAFHDFDQDGWLDLHVSNGHIPAASFIANGVATPTAFFHNQGGGTAFTEIASAAGIADPGIGRGSAYLDFDRDGDIDVAQANVAGAPRLFENVTPGAGHWARLRLIGRKSDPDAIGARITLTTAGNVRHLREVDRNEGFESSSEPHAHFGLGAATEADSLHVRWPSGIEQRWSDLPADAEYTILEPLLDVLESSSAPAEVRPGDRFEFLLDVTSRADGVLQGIEEMEILLDGVPFWRSPLGALSLAPGESTQRCVSFDVPLSLTLAQPTNYELRWTVVDLAGGADRVIRRGVLRP